MSMNRKVLQFGGHSLSLETGRIARQADGAVLVSMGDTILLVSCVASRSVRTDQDFFPLTVDYQEKTYSAGKIPGGFFKREGRPSEKEILISRLIDRSLRPLFPKDFYHEVQIVATLMSLDPEISPDIPALIGASAAVMLSGVPFNGPVAAARVGYTQDGKYLLNPSQKDLKNSELDLIVAGTQSSVLMVESEAKQLPEEIMLGAVMEGHSQFQEVIATLSALASESGKPRWEWKPSETDVNLVTTVENRFSDGIVKAYAIKDKLERKKALHDLYAEGVEAILGEESNDWSDKQVQQQYEALQSKIIRNQILEQQTRIDGRTITDIRDIKIEVGTFPRVHGSALFTRGGTQALVITTLGTDKDSQIINALEGEHRLPFMFHYNFPPYCVGETGRVGTPKRREIGHGALAKRGVLGVMPNMNDYPYTIRIVSEITESNGSSSMASVCGASLALMDAGVSTAAPVAGIAMGLVKADERFVVLSDILGDEDHLGDMDFKVAGSDQGVTALQMDIKIDGITEEIMRSALQQARQGRLHILAEMNKVLAESRQDVSRFAPRITTMKIDPSKIRDVIGKGGTTIRMITEETGAVIDIEDSGQIKISAVDQAAGKAAKKRIEQLTEDVEVGKIYEGRVSKLMDFGAFVNILPGKDGLVHISQISHERVENVSDALSEGEQIKVKVLEIDRQGRVRLSMKAIAEG